MDQESFQTLAIEQFRFIREEMQHMREEMQNMRTEIKNVRDELKVDIRELKEEAREDRKKLDGVYQSRNVVKIKFGWQWSLVSLVIAITASSITAAFSN